MTDACWGIYPQPLDHSLDKASIVMVATITEFTLSHEDALIEPDPQHMTQEKIIGYSARLNEFQSAGSYHFKVAVAIRGGLNGEFELHMPFLSSRYYGWSKFEVTKGRCVLLLLTKGTDGEWAPIDSDIPLIPLADGVVKQIHDAPPGNAAPDAIDYILASLQDASLRPALLYLLRTIKDARISKSAARFDNDSDPVVKANALYCLATNQVVEIIPDIAKMEHDDHSAKNGLVGMLGEYTDSKATPFLNPLVVDDDQWVRLNAIRSLRRIADESSIPYLILALDHDDPQHTVAFGAYWILHRLRESSLGESKDMFYFAAHQDTEIHLLKQWWVWERRKWSATTLPAAAIPH